jgi:hypothetical protein
LETTGVKRFQHYATAKVFMSGFERATTICCNASEDTVMVQRPETGVAVCYVRCTDFPEELWCLNAMKLYFMHRHCSISAWFSVKIIELSVINYAAI